MAHFLDLNTLTTSSILPSIPKLTERSKTGTFSVCRKADKVQEQGSVQELTRRMSLGFAVSIALTGTFSGNDVSLAQDNNGFWIDGPLPTPPIYNSKQSSLSKLLMLDLISLPWFLISFSFLFFFFVEKHIDFVLNKI